MLCYVVWLCAFKNLLMSNAGMQIRVAIIELHLSGRFRKVISLQSLN